MRGMGISSSAHRGINYISDARISRQQSISDVFNSSENDTSIKMNGN
jgi:hypothetical protein